MAVYEGAEEILVGSGDHSSVATRIFNCDRWWVFNRSVYLYFILMSRMDFRLINNRDSGHTPRNDMK